MIAYARIFSGSYSNKLEQRFFKSLTGSSNLSMKSYPFFTFGSFLYSLKTSENFLIWVFEVFPKRKFSRRGWIWISESGGRRLGVGYAKKPVITWLFCFKQLDRFCCLFQKEFVLHNGDYNESLLLSINLVPEEVFVNFSDFVNRRLIMMKNYFCGIVDRRRVSSFISSRGNYQKFSPSQISSTSQAEFKSAQNLRLGFIEKVVQ